MNPDGRHEYDDSSNNWPFKDSAEQLTYQRIYDPSLIEVQDEIEIDPYSHSSGLSDYVLVPSESESNDDSSSNFTLNNGLLADCNINDEFGLALPIPNDPVEGNVYEKPDFVDPNVTNLCFSGNGLSSPAVFEDSGILHVRELRTSQDEHFDGGTFLLSPQTSTELLIAIPDTMIIGDAAPSGDLRMSEHQNVIPSTVTIPNPNYDKFLYEWNIISQKVRIFCKLYKC
jgi:hypothetical protein